MINMKDLIKKQGDMIRRQTGMLKEEIIEWERIEDLEARIFDQIIDFKKTFEKSEWKKNRKVNSIINQFIKLEVKLSQAVRDANK